MVQWLRLCPFTAEVAGSVPGWGTKIPGAVGRGQRRGRGEKVGFDNASQ